MAEYLARVVHLRDEVGLVMKPVWRVKLVAELRPGAATQVDVVHIERGAQTGLAELGMPLDEAKWLTAALQAQMVSAQPVCVVGIASGPAGVGARSVRVCWT